MAKAEYRSAVRSRKMINAALADLLQEKSLDKITVTDVVNRAEINRGTFYAHYENIPDVINHLIQQTFDRIRRAIAEQSGCFQDIPGVLLQQVQNILEEDLEFYRKILNSKASIVVQEELIKIIQEYLLQEEEQFGVGNHEQYVLTMRFCAGGLSTLYQEWFAGRLPFSLDELTRRAEYLVKEVIKSVNKL